MLKKTDFFCFIWEYREGHIYKEAWTKAYRKLSVSCGEEERIEENKRKIEIKTRKCLKIVEKDRFNIVYIKIYCYIIKFE